MFVLLVICLLLIAYVYVGYPLLIAMLARMVSCQLSVGSGARALRGHVSVVIAVFNDAVVLREKLRLLLESEGDLIGEVLIGSDGSTDDVAGALTELADERIRVIEFEERRGKTAVLNDVVPQCMNDVVVMMDARQRVADGAIAALVSRFDDESVGVVSGELVFGSCQLSVVSGQLGSGSAVGRSCDFSSQRTTDNKQRTPSAAAEGMGAYWWYEKWIRKNEARVASVPGATGACYAIRKDLFQRIPDETILDDVAFPMMAVLQGFRCVFEEKAVVFDRPSDESKQEMVRKRRTLAGNVQLLQLFPSFLCLWRNPIWFQYVSHKVLRLFVPFSAILAVFSAVWVAVFGGVGNERCFSAVFLVFCVVFVCFCAFGALYERNGRKNRIFSLFWMFFVLNGVTFLGVIDGLRGRYQVMWARAYAGRYHAEIAKDAERESDEL